MSLPLHVLRFLAIDSNFLVVNSMLFMNCLLQVLGDVFLYKLAKIFLGKEGATMTLSYSLFNRRINEIFQKTLTNGTEAIFSIVGLYFFNRITPRFNKEMALMTFSITIAFLVRSSSLAGWVPLALIKVFQGWDMFFAIVLSGIFVAVPVFMLSVLADSLYYGKFAIPQVNFVYINVVENISKMFGTDPFYYYILELKYFLTADGNLF